MTYTIHNTDCLDWMRQQPHACVDIIVSSPPYNIGLNYNTYSDSRVDYYEWMRCVWSEACRILKPNGHLFINVAPTRKDPLMPYKVASSVPWVIQNTITWSKAIEYEGHVSGHVQVFASEYYLPNGMELVFHFTEHGKTKCDTRALDVSYKPQWAEYNKKKTGRTHRPTVNNWFVPYETVGSFGKRTTELKGNKKHPAIYPQALVERCIRLAGYNADTIVFDPFAGTGTTLLAAKRLGLHAIGCELDADYYQFILSRL